MWGGVGELDEGGSGGRVSVSDVMCLVGCSILFPSSMPYCRIQCIFARYQSANASGYLERVEPP